MRWSCHADRCDTSDAMLQSLIDGSLSAGEERRLTKSVEGCSKCQATLMELAADSDDWSVVHDALGACVTESSESSKCDSYSVSNTEFGLAELQSLGMVQPPEVAQSIGRVDRYDLLEVLGAGGTGIVFKARDRLLERIIAIKFLSPALSSHGPARQRFAREAQAAAAVTNDRVVTVHHVIADVRCPYLVMQYIDGESLQEKVMRDGPLEINVALRLTAQAVEALHAAHEQGLVHRDIKPANLLIGSSGQRLWVTDFGLARAVDDASLTRTGFVAGTPHYMSPEQSRGHVVSASSDLFSLGGTLYFMLTGRVPFRADNTLAILRRICDEPHHPLSDLRPETPKVICELVDGLLQKCMTDRPSSAEEVQSQCVRLIEAIQNGRLPKTIKQQRLRRIAVPVLLLGLIACLFPLFVNRAKLSDASPSIPTNRNETSSSKPAFAEMSSYQSTLQRSRTARSFQDDVGFSPKASLPLKTNERQIENLSENLSRNALASGFDEKRGLAPSRLMGIRMGSNATVPSKANEELVWRTDMRHLEQDMNEFERVIEHQLLPTRFVPDDWSDEFRSLESLFIEN
ncbi:MAG: serine/threonine-protein kinase [Planctomycetota bacterium]